MTGPTVGELVELTQVEPVVRLDGTSGRLSDLVLTGDVEKSLAAVLDAAGAADGKGSGGGSGAAFFVVGPFGSGKSHFLAALGELLADPRRAVAAGSWSPGLRELARSARRSTAVAVPLVEYRAEASLEDVIAARTRRALRGEAGGTRASPGAWAGPGPDGSQSPGLEGADRLAIWDALLEAVLAGGAEGLVLLVDELSEFLRAKRGPALTEDLRYLQFLGEWVRDRPVVVCCALQESIEEVANVSRRELARIRDRFRPSLTLSMRHVEDLVRGRLVRLRPGAEGWVDRARSEIERAHPGGGVDAERFSRCYPLHAGTLDLLEGLRFLLSQSRGVVEFICAQVSADLGRPYSELVTPDRLYDHFSGRLHERAETARLADTVVPYYERAAAELVDAGDEGLALRAVKLLCLQSVSGIERPRTAAELAALLLVRVSEVEPEANASYLEQAVLQRLATRGAYVVQEPGPPATYRVELGADAALVVRERLAAARAELSPGDRRLVATCAEVGSSPALPLQLLAEVGASRRETLWQNTLRAVVVGTARVLELGPAEVQELARSALEAGAEGCLIVGELEPTDAAAALEHARRLAAAPPPVGRGTPDGAKRQEELPGRVAFWVPAALSAEEVDTLLDIHSRRIVLAAARDEGRGDLAAVLEQASEADQALARELLRRAYFSGRVVYPPPAAGTTAPAGPDLPSIAGMTFERQLPHLVEPLLSGLHPRHLEVAPRGELVGERLLRRLLEEVIAPGRLGPAALSRGQLRSLVEGYLVPLGLARVRKEGATLAPDSSRSPAVGELLRLVGHGEPVAALEVVRQLADGPLGLSEPESMLVLNACERSGLVERWRGRRRVEGVFITLTAQDRIGAGELAEPEVRARVPTLGPICGPGPFEPWSASTQRVAWDYAKAWLAERREQVAEVKSGLAALAELPTLAAAKPGALLADLETVGALLAACDDQQAAPAGLRQLVDAATDPPALLAASRRVAAAARFCRDELRRWDAAAAYLTHPDLVVPEEDAGLVALLERARRLLGEVLELAAEERLGELDAANRELRTAYLAAYQEAHDRYYAAIGPADLRRVRSDDRYRALSALSGVGAVAVPDDRVKVDRYLQAAVPEPCHRRIDLELAWKPRCHCGFSLGDRPPVLEGEAALEMAERGVRQHLAELARPEQLERISSAIGDLERLGRDELAADLGRLIELAGRPDRASCSEVASLVGPELVAVLRDVLGGGRLIATRDLAELREDLIGRRYTKRRLLELFSSWVDPGGDLPPGAFVEVADSSERPGPVRPGTAPGGPGERARGGVGASVVPGGSSAAGGEVGQTFSPAGSHRRRPAPPAGGDGLPASSATGAFLAGRYPSLAALLPFHQQADAFWLSAWWAGRAGAPAWLPAGLLAEGAWLAEASEAALADADALEELAELDARVSEASVLGRQVAETLEVATLPLAGIVEILREERLFRYPLRLAADQLLRRLPADWQIAEQLDAQQLGARHALAGEAELAPVRLLIDAARHLWAAERELADATCRELVEGLYPDHLAPAFELLSRAELALVGAALVGSDAVEALRGGATRLRRQAEAVFRRQADAGFPGCMLVHEIGQRVVEPLLAEHGRVAVLLVDAMRADVSARLLPALRRTLPGRRLTRRWAVVPEPTRTAESLAALSLGRPVPGGSAQGEGTEPARPFAHLGHEVAVVVGADRDHRAEEVRALWDAGPPISVAVATGLDERLHRSSVEPAALVDEAAVALDRRAVASLGALRADVPLVVLADHGFRENPRWGQGPEGRYVHGGCSLEECVVPVLVFGPRGS